MPKTAILNEQNHLVGYEDVDDPGDRVVVSDNCDLPTDATYRWLSEQNSFWPVRSGTPPKTKRPPAASIVNRARWFLEDMVKGAYAEWRSDPLCERHARCAAGFANDMVEWAYHHLGLGSEFKCATDFRTHMKKKHREVHIVADVANGTKHVELTKGPIIVTKAEQTRLHEYGCIDSVPDFDSIDDFDTLSKWIVELDNGSREALGPLLEACIQIWEDFLKKKGV